MAKTKKAEEVVEVVEEAVMEVVEAPVYKLPLLSLELHREDLNLVVAKINEIIKSL